MSERTAGRADVGRSLGWRRLDRVTAVSGLAAVILLFAGVGLVASRFVWTSQLWLAPYFLFWIWVVIVSVLLLIRSSGSR